MSAPIFNRLALLGLGLIGSSVARAARDRGLVREIIGHARSAETRATATRLQLCDSVHERAADAVVDADLVLLCTPVGAFAELAQEIAPQLAAGAIVSDVGGVKQSVIVAVRPLIPDSCHFVPGHPIAGTEHSGPESGFAELFEQRWCVLTPLADTDPEAVDRVQALWEGLGSTVERMSPEHHDQILAITSHLPHAIAYTMVGVAGDVETVAEREVVKYSASGFRDFTRIAASDPVMWRDLLLANRDEVLEGLGRFMEELHVLQKAIRWQDGDTLEQHFRRGRELRRGVVEAGQDAEGSEFYLSRSGGKPPGSSEGG